MMDYVVSRIIFAILLLTIATIQVNINSTMYQDTFSVRVQGNAAELGCQFGTRHSEYGLPCIE